MRVKGGLCQDMESAWIRNGEERPSSRRRKKRIEACMEFD